MSLSTIFRSPHFIDLILAFTVLEGLFLILARRRLHFHRAENARETRPAAIVLLLLPGLCLMLALRAALAGAAWPWLPVALAAALIAHLADIRARWFD